MNELDRLIVECARDCDTWYPELQFSHWYDSSKDSYLLKVFKKSLPNLVTSRVHYASDINSKKEGIREFILNEYKEIGESVVGHKLEKPDLSDEINSADDEIDARNRKKVEQKIMEDSLSGSSVASEIVQSKDDPMDKLSEAINSAVNEREATNLVAHNCVAHECTAENSTVNEYAVAADMEDINLNDPRIKSFRETKKIGQAEIEKEVQFDNWKHRSEEMKCSTCMWYVQKEWDKDRSTEIGRCRRHAPTMSGFPVVFSSDWCGDHKLDEAKV